MESAQQSLAEPMDEQGNILMLDNSYSKARQAPSQGCCVAATPLRAPKNLPVVIVEERSDEASERIGYRHTPLGRPYGKPGFIRHHNLSLNESTGAYTAQWTRLSYQHRSSGIPWGTVHAIRGSAPVHGARPGESACLAIIEEVLRGGSDVECRKLSQRTISDELWRFVCFHVVIHKIGIRENHVCVDSELTYQSRPAQIA